MSLSLSKIKLVRSLRQKKFRQKYNFFIVEGPKIAIEALSSSSTEIVEIFATESWITEQSSLLYDYQSIITVVSEKELKKVSTLKTPNLVLILAKIPDLTVNHSLTAVGAHLYCDEIKDPGNLGTIIRIADWFGIASVTLSEGCVDPFNPKTIQATMGSIMRLPVAYLDQKSLATFFNSFDQSYGAVMNGENIYATKLATNALFVIGNESNGIKDEVRNSCSKLITIPKDLETQVESLNAAVATGILCAEYKRQIIVSANNT